MSGPRSPYRPPGPRRRRSGGRDPLGMGHPVPRQQLQRDLHDAIVSAETELDEVRTAFHRAQAHMEGVQDALSHLVSGTEETEKP